MSAPNLEDKDCGCEHSGMMDAEVAQLLILAEEIRNSQKETASLVQQFIDGVKPMIDEVVPKVQAIAESSWFRMISGGKKK